MVSVALLFSRCFVLLRFLPLLPAWLVRNRFSGDEFGGPSRRTDGATTASFNRRPSSHVGWVDHVAVSSPKAVPELLSLSWLLFLLSLLLLLWLLLMLLLLLLLLLMLLLSLLLLLLFVVV